MNFNVLRSTFGLVAIAGLVGTASAQVNLTVLGTPATEDFDSLGNTATASLPAGWKMDSATQTTVYANAASATTRAAGSSGTGVLTSSSSGGAYNFADGVTATSTDRSIGYLNSGSYARPRQIFASVANNTGNTIRSLTVDWDFEKYRSGTRAWTWTFYGSTDGINWVAYPAGDQAYAADANNTTVFDPPTVTAKSVSMGNVLIPTGETYYIRWQMTANGDTNGQAIGIDNVSITGATIGNTLVNAASTTGGWSTVGSGGNYATLATATAAISGSVTGLAGPWRLEILGNITETANSFLANRAAVDHPIIIGVAQGATAVVTQANIDNAGWSGHLVLGAYDAAALGNISTTDNVVIDGSTAYDDAARSLTLQNAVAADTNGRPIRVIGECNSLIVKNANFYNRASTSALETFGLTSYNNGTTNFIPDNVTIDNCDISQTGTGIGFGLVCTNSGTITGRQTGLIVRNSLISSRQRTIYLNQNGNFDIYNNTIRLNNTTGGFTCLPLAHVTANSGTNLTCNIYNNKFDQLVTANVNGGNFGIQSVIDMIGATGSTYNVYNNMICGISYTGAANAVDVPYRGIRSTSGATIFNIYNNSIDMPNFANYTGIGTTPSNVGAIILTSTAPTVTRNIKNNIIRCAFTASTFGGRCFNLGSVTNTNLDYNALFVTGANAKVGRTNTTDYVTFANWQNQGGGTAVVDINSQNLDPFAAVGSKWTSATNLHWDVVNVKPTGWKSGFPVSSPAITTDIDGQARSASSPYKGCDELIDAAAQFNGVAVITTPSGTDFGTVEDYTAPADLPVRIANQAGSDGNLLINSVTATGPSGEITVASASAGTVLAAGQSTGLTAPIDPQIRYRPTSVGTVTNDIAVLVSDSLSPTEITFQGTGQDVTNPTVTAVARITSQTVDVTFSEPMEALVTDASKYTLSGAGQGTLANTPDSVALVSGNKYRLTWTSGEMQTGSDITVTVDSTLQDVHSLTLGANNSGTHVAGGLGVAPVSSGSAVDVTQVGTSISVDFTASDEGSGVASTSLFVKGPSDGSFSNSGLTPLAGASGTFSYTAAANGQYGFYTVTTDVAGNAETAPAGADVTITVNTVENGLMTQAAVTGNDTLVFPMTSALDVTVSLAGATPAGTVAVSRTTPLGTPPAYFQHPEKLLNELLDITGSGLGTFTASLTWQYDAANTAGMGGDPVSHVYQFDGGASPTASFSVTPVGNVLTIPGITSFSTWYAGNSIAVPVSVSAFAIE